jgi:hypothetical protein
MMLPHEKRLYDCIVELIHDGFGAQLQALAKQLDAERDRERRTEFCAQRIYHDLIARVAH